IAADILGGPPTSRGQEPVPAFSTGDLLRAVPFDRLTLTDGTVVFIDPVSPRPLPVYDPTKERERRRRSTENPAIKLVEIGRPGEPEKPVVPEKVQGDPADPGDELKIHLLQGGPGEVRDYKVKRANIKKIEYFEDLLLQEADRLALSHDYAGAI